MINLQRKLMLQLINLS